MNRIRYELSAPEIPGAAPTVVASYPSIVDARFAAERFQGRRDLTYQDVRIDKTGRSFSKFVEYCGPTR